MSSKSQADKFKDAARAAKCDEDEARWVATLRKVVKKKMRIKAAIGAVLLTLAAPVPAQVPASDHPEMAAIYAADQAPRSGTGASIDWAAVAPQDEARRARTKALLDAGSLQTANDFYYAATVFQHGSQPSDYMLAHTLAVIAAARGRADATGMAAATLDRYLMAVGHSQIYGTQFNTPDRKNTTQEPFDRSLVSDELRKALDVPSLAEQEKRRQAIEERYRATPNP